jgi:two-component system response regulator
MTDKFILLVEDDPDDQTLAMRALRKNNVWNDVEIAQDGVEALDFLFGTGSYCGRDMSRQPALVLLDLKLPRLGGFEVLRRIRADRRTKDLAVIIVTSSWDPDDILQGYGLRADGYVCKSVNFEKFSAALGHLCLDGLLAEEKTAGRSANESGREAATRRAARCGAIQRE